MAVYVTQAISNDAVKLRWKEPYASSGLNRKSLVVEPRGMHAGFHVQPGVSGGHWVDAVVDPTLNLSVAVMAETTGGTYAPTIVLESDLMVNLAAQAGLTVYLVLDVQYGIGFTTAAQLKVVDAAEVLANPDFLVLARVDVPVAPPVLEAHINRAYGLRAGDSLQDNQKPRANLLFNPGMEGDPDAADPTGWASTGGGLVATASTDNAHTGTKSMKLVAAAPVSLQVDSARVPVVSGMTYRAGAWLRSTGGDPIAGGNGVKLEVSFSDRSLSPVGSPTQVDDDFTGGGVAYVERKGEVVAPAEAAYATLSVVYDNCQGTLYVDDLEFSSRESDNLAKSMVFGGPNVVADDAHKHSAGVLTYGGSSPTQWADTTTLAAGTVESGLDGVVGALGASAGTAKVGGAAKAGSPKSLAAGAAKAQLEELLGHHNDHLNAVANAHPTSAIDGVAKVGTPDSLSTGTARAQLEELLGFINARSLKDPPSWTAMTLVAPWSALGYTPSYRIEASSKRVFLRGLMTATVASSADWDFWVVPVGYRPLVDIYLSAVAFDDVSGKYRNCVLHYVNGTTSFEILTVEGADPAAADYTVCLDGMSWAID